MAKGKETLIADVVYQDLKPGERAPVMAIYQVGPKGDPIKQLACSKDLRIELKRNWGKLGHAVALGPDTKNPSELRRETLLLYRVESVWPRWAAQERIYISSDNWRSWFYETICVSGTVEWCPPPWPWPGSLGQIVLPLPFPLPPWPPAECLPICDGVVEIYERVCCCSDWLDIDPRIDVIIPILEELICWPKFPIPKPPCPPDPFPPGPFPPGPGPDPSPIDIGRDLLRGFKLHDATINPAEGQPPSERLVRDHYALQKLSRVEASRYVKERAYLWPLICSCTTKKVGEAPLGPGGTFDFCYERPLQFVIRGRKCTTTYAYKVKQWIFNQWITIYDGLAADEYFTKDDPADITTHHFWAVPCGDPPPPPVPEDGLKPFVLLQEVGSTNSHHMVSPVQTGEGKIDLPLPANGGLVFPPPSGGSAAGKLLNRPWAQRLNLRLYIHPGMEALGAHYYRISTVRCDALGNPLWGATPQPLAGPVAWRRWVYGGASSTPTIATDVLGPNSVTFAGQPQNALYKIPYWDVNRLWLSGQFHHYWETPSGANGQHLLLLEIFDVNGERMKPLAAPATSPGKAVDFCFLRWTDPLVTEDVPFAELAHLFWVDNLACYADIVDVRQGGVESADICQFLTGTETSQFSVGFRAFHTKGPVLEPFMLNYRLWYTRGLSGSGTIEIGNQNRPPSLGAGPPAESSSLSFGAMLDGEPKCSFAVNLRVLAKHTNGYGGRITQYDRYDQIAVALEIGP
ncbi:MAG: hypothetical protein O7H41_15355 [Planctomycetota bacterium]|nr:hypothetical protein [Planctomycetota bacterium]